MMSKGMSNTEIALKRVTHVTKGPSDTEITLKRVPLMSKGMSNTEIIALKRVTHDV